MFGKPAAPGSTLDQVTKAVEILRRSTAMEMLNSAGTLATDDTLLIRDVSEAEVFKVTLANMLAIINSLTSLTAVDTDADLLAVYDASASAIRKVLVSDILKHIGFPFGWPSGHYFYGIGQAAGGTHTVSANTLYAAHMLITQPITFDRIFCEVTTGTAGNVRLGIYEHDYSTHKPGARVLDAGTADTAAAAVKEITISQLLAPGKYWTVAVFDATPTVRRHNGGGEWFMWPSGNTVNNDEAGLPALGLSVGFTYAALPSTFPGGSTFRQPANTVRVGLRAS